MFTQLPVNNPAINSFLEKVSRISIGSTLGFCKPFTSLSEITAIAKLMLEESCPTEFSKVFSVAQSVNASHIPQLLPAPERISVIPAQLSEPYFGAYYARTYAFFAENPVMWVLIGYALWSTYLCYKVHQKNKPKDFKDLKAASTPQAIWKKTEESALKIFNGTYYLSNNPNLPPKIKGLLSLSFSRLSKIYEFALSLIMTLEFIKGRIPGTAASLQGLLTQFCGFLNPLIFFFFPVNFFSYLVLAYFLPAYATRVWIKLVDKGLDKAIDFSKNIKNPSPRLSAANSIINVITKFPVYLSIAPVLLYTHVFLGLQYQLGLTDSAVVSRTFDITKAEHKAIMNNALELADIIVSGKATPEQLTAAKNPTNPDVYTEIGSVMIQWLKNNANELESNAGIFEDKIIPAVEKMDLRTRKEFITTIRENETIRFFCESGESVNKALGSMQSKLTGKKNKVLFDYSAQAQFLGGAFKEKRLSTHAYK